ncbi:esterase-like activity of phytase family protein [Aureispira anguillae]|uniref:Phytase-like domain-containing protein n=1 Tax=Aureispira anguillae TaxID=2864201 RepID=A0A915YC98_9BACT|nr:esterase-like activity of phytase family protein [Aureispira anguillae]BDS10442.1 hypothetical protein AsAng_0011500 [Aureispira anguillae]
MKLLKIYSTIGLWVLISYMGFSQGNKPIEWTNFDAAPEFSSLLEYEGDLYTTYEREVQKLVRIKNEQIDTSIPYQLEKRPTKSMEIEGMAVVDSLFLLLDETNALIHVLNINDYKKGKEMVAYSIETGLKKAKEESSKYGLEGIAVNPEKKQIYLARENIEGTTDKTVIYRFQYAINAQDGRLEMKGIDSTTVHFSENYRVADLYYFNATLYALATHQKNNKYTIFSMEIVESSGNLLRNTDGILKNPTVVFDFSKKGTSQANYEGMVGYQNSFYVLSDESEKQKRSFLLKLDPKEIPTEVDTNITPFKTPNVNGIKSSSNLFLCSDFLADENLQKKGSCCPLNIKCCDTIPNKFNWVFQANCMAYLEKNNNAITPKYITVYDKRDGTLSYLKLKRKKEQKKKKKKKKEENKDQEPKPKNNNNNSTDKKKECTNNNCKAFNFEYVKPKKVIFPIAGREMLFVVIEEDESINLEVGSEQYFLEYESAFKTIIESGGKPAPASDATPKAKSKASDVGDDKAELVEEKESRTQLDKLAILREALATLNKHHHAKVIISQQYYDDLFCLRFSIMEEFGTGNFIKDSVSRANLIIEAKQLETELLKVFSDNPTPKALFLIGAIKVAYLEFALKQLEGYKTYFRQITIPDEDVFKFTLKKGEGNAIKNILSRSFRVSGGFKIDFSAGVFLSGLSTREYVVQTHHYKYKTASFSVNSSGGIDTTYTGQLRDTSGYKIHIKDPKMNYGVGLLSHAYFRTGLHSNFALSTGLLVNDVGVQILVGGSLLLNIKNSRLSLTSGLVIGQRRIISPTAEPYLWDETEKDGSVYDLPGEVPVLYNVTDVPTFVQWNCSWFFGLTYNFSSISI